MFRTEYWRCQTLLFEIPCSRLNPAKLKKKPNLYIGTSSWFFFVNDWFIEMSRIWEGLKNVFVKVFFFCLSAGNGLGYFLALIAFLNNLLVKTMPAFGLISNWYFDNLWLDAIIFAKIDTKRLIPHKYISQRVRTNGIYRNTKF